AEFEDISVGKRLRGVFTPSLKSPSIQIGWSTLRRLPLLPNGTAFFHLPDVVGRKRHLAGRVASVYFDPADLLSNFFGQAGQILDVTADTNDQGIHRITNII